MLTHSEGLMKKKLQRQYGKSKRRTRKARQQLQKLMLLN